MEEYDGVLVGCLEETKQHSEYFDGILDNLYQEQKDTEVVRRYGFLGLCKEVRLVPETRYYALVKIVASDIKIRIPITRVLSEALIVEDRIGQKVSVHLNFSYDFMCWHLKDEENLGKPKTKCLDII